MSTGIDDSRRLSGGQSTYLHVRAFGGSDAYLGPLYIVCVRHGQFYMLSGYLPIYSLLSRVERIFRQAISDAQLRGEAIWIKLFQHLHKSNYFGVSYVPTSCKGV